MADVDLNQPRYAQPRQPSVPTPPGALVPPGMYNPSNNHDQYRRDVAGGAADTYDPAFGAYVGVTGSQQPLSDIAAKLAAWRKEGAAAGYRVDQTDANILGDQQFIDWTPGAGNKNFVSLDGPKPGAQQGGQSSQWPGFQFDDPYTQMLEGIASKQMGEVRSNPGLDQLTNFLQTQFKDLSTAPGYSPQEMAMLRTQAFEPVEDYRQASKQRALERTSARGMLPSSGLHELDMRDIDRSADRTRTQLDRDVAIGAIDRRDSDLNRAGTIANQLGLQIPGAQRSEELALGSLLYDLPNKALQNALAVVNGSPTSSDLFSQAVQLANVNSQNQYQNQQQTQQRWAQIAQLLAGMDF